MLKKIKMALKELGTHHLIERKHLKLSLHIYPIGKIAAVSGKVFCFRFTYKHEEKWKIPNFDTIVWKGTSSHIEPGTQIIMRTDKLNCSILIPQNR